MGNVRSGAALRTAVPGGKIPGAHAEQLRGQHPLGQAAGQEVIASPGDHGAGPVQFSPFQEFSGPAFQSGNRLGGLLPGYAEGRAGSHNKL